VWCGADLLTGSDGAEGNFGETLIEIWPHRNAAHGFTSFNYDHGLVVPAVGGWEG